MFIEKKDGPVGAISMKDLVCVKTKIPTYIVRLRNRIPNVKFSIIGPTSDDETFPKVKEKRFIVVTDVITSGTTAIEAANIIRKAGGIVTKVYAIYDRERLKGNKLKEK